MRPRREKNLRQAAAMEKEIRKGQVVIALRGGSDEDGRWPPDRSLWNFEQRAKDKLRQAEWLKGAPARRKAKQHGTKAVIIRHVSEHEQRETLRHGLEALADAAQTKADVYLASDRAERRGLPREIVKELWLRAARAYGLRTNSNEDCKQRRLHFQHAPCHSHGCYWCQLKARGQVDKKGKVI